MVEEVEEQVGDRWARDKFLMAYGEMNMGLSHEGGGEGGGGATTKAQDGGEGIVKVGATYGKRWGGCPRCSNLSARGKSASDMDHHFYMRSEAH